MQILIAYWGAVDRQWLQEHREKLQQEKAKQREQARQVRRTPSKAKPISFMGNGPAKPLRFDSQKPFMTPARLNQLGSDCMDRFRF